MIKNKLQLIAWASYDWASSAFPIIVTTFIFAPYFTKKVAVNDIVGTFQWATATAIAGVIIAIMSPIFGAIADYRGQHKRWVLFFTIICIIASALLWFVYPEPSSIFFALICVVIGTISLEIGAVFYNSFLPHLAPPDYIGRVSGWAWGFGYLGGILALSIVLFGLIKHTPSWLDIQSAAQIRMSGPLAAIWFAIFSLPFFIFIPDSPRTSFTNYAAITKGLNELWKTIRSLPKLKNLSLYLIAHLLYADGLNTMFAFGGIYAAGTFGMDLSEVILFGITMNIFAGVGAILLAWVDDFLGSKVTILISLVGLILLGIPLVFVSSQFAFWSLALGLGLFVGPVQSASRSLMARLAPIDKSTEFFGLYAFSGRITAFLGPWVLGLATYHFNTQRAGMATILVFFALGGLCLLGVQGGKSRLGPT